MKKYRFLEHRARPVGLPQAGWKNWGKTTGKLTVVLAILFSESTTSAKDLVDLIPGLYGGNGISLATAPAASHIAHYTIGSTASINRLNQQLATEIGVFPFSSAVGGFTFAFEPALGTFVSTTETLGPLFAERAPTLGQGKFNLHFSSTFFTYDEFEGQDLDNLRVIAPHDPDIIGFPDKHEQFELDDVLIKFNTDIDVKIFSLAATYGLTDRLDVGILVPIVSVDMKVKSQARLIESPGNTLFPGVHKFDDAIESPIDRASDDATGLGDIILRAKYYLLDSDIVDVAGAVLIKLETGDEDNFLGTGTTTLRPFLVFSHTYADLLPWDTFITPHLNVGYEFNLGDDDRSSVEYVAGFDVGTERVTLIWDLLGSNEPYGDNIGDDILTSSVGIKWNVFRQFLLFANFQQPLNEDGLRSDLIYTFGMEHSF